MKDWIFYYTVCIVLLSFLGLGIVLAQHGKPKTGKQNFFVSLASVGIYVPILGRALGVW